ncbi:ABC transporter ATP-binding protein [Alphaproteobacteria bacterium]|nr:ABC transporter ATP-binding protein [Alphaproteobacteria bacterium]
MTFLKLTDVCLDYPIYHASSRSIKKSILSSAGSKFGAQKKISGDSSNRVNIRALSGITLEIKEGDRLALIGANGSGKTTLLKVLNGIYVPTLGDFRSSGKVYSLLDIFLGIDQESTGYENIKLRGMFMGLSSKLMSKHIQEIENFTELGPFLNMPIRTYSSGMLVRLTFAIATCVSPEILLMDEWLSAGDASFFAKAQQRLEKLVGETSILVLASHDLTLLDRWCNRAVLIEHGIITANGSVGEITAMYNERSKAALANKA